MKFGLLYLTDYHPEAHGTYTTYYERMLDQIITAEALGFDGGRYGECCLLYCIALYTGSKVVEQT